MFCPSCGASLAPGSKFCPSCGAAVPQEAPAAPVNTPSAAPQAPVPPVSQTAVPPVNQAPVAPAAAAPAVSQDNMTMILRVVCGVMGAAFALFTLQGAFNLLRSLFGGLVGLF